jgi:hypothetical protein
MNSCGIRWLYIMYCKWLLPSIIDTAEHHVQCCPPSAAEHHSQCWLAPVELCLSRLLWCEVCTSTLSPPGSPKERYLEMTSLEIGGATGSFKGLSCSEAKTHTVKTHATQCHLLWQQHITHAQFWHEQAMLLKQVPSASDNFFKNYKRKQMGILYESSDTRGNNIGSVFGATWNKISITFFILTVYSLLLLIWSHNFFGCHWHSFTTFSKIIMLIFLFLEFSTLVSDKQIKHYMRYDIFTTEDLISGLHRDITEKIII